MLLHLLASRPRAQCSSGSVLLSVVLHAALIALATSWARTEAPGAPNPSAAHPIFFNPPASDAPPPATDTPASRPPAVPWMPTAPGPPVRPYIDVPVELPRVTSMPVSVAADVFGSDALTPGLARSPDSGARRRGGSDNAPRFQFDVEKPAIVLPSDLRPRYPEPLRAGGLEGSVLVQFVVDTTGRADIGTFRQLRSDHELFTRAVREALPSMRFLPAEHGGRRVRVVVQQSFEFRFGR